MNQNELTNHNKDILLTSTFQSKNLNFLIYLMDFTNIIEDNIIFSEIIKIDWPEVISYLNNLKGMDEEFVIKMLSIFHREIINYCHQDLHIRCFDLLKDQMIDNDILWSHLLQSIEEKRQKTSILQSVNVPIYMLLDEDMSDSSLDSGGFLLRNWLKIKKALTNKKEQHVSKLCYPNCYMYLSGQRLDKTRANSFYMYTKLESTLKKKKSNSVLIKI